MCNQEWVFYVYLSTALNLLFLNQCLSYCLWIMDVAQQESKS